MTISREEGNFQVQDGRGLGLYSWRKISEWLGARPGRLGARPGRLGARPGQLENKSRMVGG